MHFRFGFEKYFISKIPFLKILSTFQITFLVFSLRKCQLGSLIKILLTYILRIWFFQICYSPHIVLFWKEKQI